MIFRIRPQILLLGDSLTQLGFGEIPVPMTSGSSCSSSSSSSSATTTCRNFEKMTNYYQLGWSSLLAAAYSRRADVLNRGFSGYNTRHALSILPSLLDTTVDTSSSSSSSSSSSLAVLPNGTSTKSISNPSNPVLFCTVFLGANDASSPMSPQHIPKDEFAHNLQRILHFLQERIPHHPILPTESHDKKCPIILITPPPVSSHKWHYYCTVVSPRPNYSPRSNQQVWEYGKIIQQIGKEMNCPVLDTFELFYGKDPKGNFRVDDDDIEEEEEEYRDIDQNGNANVHGHDGIHVQKESKNHHNHKKKERQYEKYLYDGLHLNGEGNLILYQALMDLIQKEFPHLAPMVDGEGRYGTIGIPLEEKLWKELC